MPAIAEYDYSLILASQYPLEQSELFDALLAELKPRIEPGWSLNPGALRSVVHAVERRMSAVERVCVVEFGAGVSTIFLRRYFGDQIDLLSIEHEPGWAAQVEEECGAHVRLTPLVTYDDYWFTQWQDRSAAVESIRAHSHSVPMERNKDLSIPNCFYDLCLADVPDAHLYIVDGPHGNGRSIAFRYIAEVKSGRCQVLVDDANHYPFLYHCGRLLRYNVAAGEFLPGKRWCLLDVE